MELQKIKRKTSIGAAVVSAISLKLCCWGPLFLTSVAGVSGSSAYFSWLIVFKPYLLAIAFLSLGFSFYQVYKPQKINICCIPNRETENKSLIYSKIYVWFVAFIVISMSVITYFPQPFNLISNSKNTITEQSNIEMIKLNIEGMVCNRCESNINQTISQLDGFIAINTSYKKGISEIEFDHTKTTKSEIKNVIAAKGYIVTSEKNE